MAQKPSSESVDSPANSITGVQKNAGGMPETWDVERIWKENTAPSQPASDSTKNMGSKSGSSDMGGK